MRKLIILVAVVCFGIVLFLQRTSFCHEEHHIGSQSAVKTDAVTNQKDTDSVVLNPDEAPSIVFENLDHDFGTVYAGEKAEHLFKFENKGKGGLVIKQVKTSCGCTAAATNKENISPGSFGEIKATFNAGQSAGKVKKVITVTTNDPVKPKVNLSVAANVIQEVITKPQWINFGSITKGEIGAQTIEVSPGTDFNLEVTGVESDNPHVSASYKKHEDGKSYIITTTTKDDVPIGKIKGKLIVTNNSKRQQKLFIPFTGDITGDVLVSRNVLSYGTVTQGKESVRKLIVTLKKKDIDIKDVEVTPTFLSANLQPKANPDLPYREVEVKIKDDAPVGKIMGNVKIHTSSELQPVVEIPVLGEVVERVTKKS